MRRIVGSCGFASVVLISSTKDHSKIMSVHLEMAMHRIVTTSTPMFMRVKKKRTKKVMMKNIEMEDMFLQV